MDNAPDPVIPPPPPSPQRVASRMMAGVLLIVLGAVFFVDRLGWTWTWLGGWHPTFARMWPVLLIVVGLMKIFAPWSEATVTITDASGTRTRVRRGRHGGEWVVLIVGVLMLLHQNHWMSIEQSWPLFIVAAGVSLLLGRSGTRWREN